MNNDDPFDNSYIDDDKTILRPIPGGRKSQINQIPSTTPPLNTENFSKNLHAVTNNTNSAHNTLVTAAIALLSIVAQLRNTAAHTDIANLRVNVIEEIKQFENRIKQQGVSNEQVQAAKYALCTLLDETVLNTPWGCNSLWSTQSLLIFFHKESWGGEKFFVILKDCMQRPGTHLELLELLYFCLCLGFEGRYRIEDHGSTKLEEIRENVYQIIQRQRGDTDRNLSLHWKGIKDKRNKLTQFVPLWIIGSIAALTLMLIFLGFLYWINLISNPWLAKLYEMKDSFNAQLIVTKDIEPSSINQLETLSALLKNEIDNSDIEILNKNGKIILRIISKGFFASGSDKIINKYHPVINKIAQALSGFSGNILVVGHTDNSPIFSAKFPSNWELSKARALSVETILSNYKLNANVTSEGRADTQPIVANDSPTHKSINRRVEIIL